ncbi:hypothetical protein Gotur_025666 [Gossypium turneri]
MWWRSASFILDRQQHQNGTIAPSPESFLLSSPPPMADSPLNPKSNISAYYQTRAAHHAVVTSDWLAQAQAAVGRHSDDDGSLGGDKGAAPIGGGGGGGGGGGEGSGKASSVIDEFNSWRKQPALAEAVAAIRALAAVIRTSEATTMMELEIELKKASDSLKVTLSSVEGMFLVACHIYEEALYTSVANTCSYELLYAIEFVLDTCYMLTHYVLENFNVMSWDTTSISLTAGCDLFMLYVTRTSALEYEDFNSAKSRLIERAEKFGEISCKARRIIAMLSQDFIFDGCTILVHGFSRVVLEVLKTAAENKKHFKSSHCFNTEGRPDRTGLRFSNELAKLDVPVKLLIDSAVAYTMDEVDMVLFGADGVVESGGIINMMGTFQIALVAHSMNKPVYVAAESYKFARHYPLDQKDMGPARRPIDFGVPIPSKVEVETSARDYTPPQYLTLLFTDLGVLTPSVISDELIQLYL